MSINRITAPLKPPASDDDWSNTQAIIDALALGIEGPLRVVGTNVVRGSVFNIGGSVYIAVADTAITGTASKYVKLTPSGSSASASFVASLSGVTWNSTYNGYYDGSNNLYIFDELQAYASGVISAIRSTRQGNYATQDRLGIGNGCKAGLNATAMGVGSTALGLNATSVGKGNTATDSGSTAFGRDNVSTGSVATAVGATNTASGVGSAAVGFGNNASGDRSFAAGFIQTCDTREETAINSIRYVRFPEGTTHAAVFTKLYALLGSSPVVRRLSAMGSYGHGGGIRMLSVTSSTSVGITYQIYDGSSYNDVFLTLNAGSSTPLSSTLRILFVSGFEA